MNGTTMLLDRRRALQGIAAIGAGTVLLPAARQETAAQQATPVTTVLTDDAILTFVLNLEYLEAEYYLRGTTGDGISADDVGSDPGTVTGGSQVPFATDAYRQFAEEIAGNELAHVRYYREE